MQATRHRRHRGRRTDSQPREVLAIRLLVLGRENGSGDLAMMKRNCYNVVVFKPQTQGLGGALRCAGRGTPPPLVEVVGLMFRTEDVVFYLF